MGLYLTVQCVCVCVKFHKLVGTQPSNFAKFFCYIVRNLEDTLKLSFVSISKFASVIQMLEPSRYKYMLVSHLYSPCESVKLHSFLLLWALREGGGGQGQRGKGVKSEGV